MGRLPKDGRVIVTWCPFEKDIMYRWGKGARVGVNIAYMYFTIKPHSILDGALENFMDKLEKEGYDLTTFRFQIDKKRKV